MENLTGWYAVKCLLEHPTRKRDHEDHLYEERITIWYASSYEDAFEQAEVEANSYAQESRARFLCVSDAFRLFDSEFKVGTEVYAAMRGSNMAHDLYLNTFCRTPKDRV